MYKAEDELTDRCITLHRNKAINKSIAAQAATTVSSQHLHTQDIVKQVYSTGQSIMMTYVKASCLNYSVFIIQLMLITVIAPIIRRSFCTALLRLTMFLDNVSGSGSFSTTFTRSLAYYASVLEAVMSVHCQTRARLIIVGRSCCWCCCRCRLAVFEFSRAHQVALYVRKSNIPGSYCICYYWLVIMAV